MKFCSKCGKELFDESVICPGCGCPVENSNVFAKDFQRIKINTALILNIFAVVISFCSGFIYSGLTEDSIEAAFGSFFSDPLVYRLFGLVAISFILCVVNAIIFSKNRSRSIFAWIYIASVIATVAYFAILSPVYFFTTICGSGILFPVAPILQVIAAVKIIQATK